MYRETRSRGGCLLFSRRACTLRSAAETLLPRENKRAGGGIGTNRTYRGKKIDQRVYVRIRTYVTHFAQRPLRVLQTNLKEKRFGNNLIIFTPTTDRCSFKFFWISFIFFFFLLFFFFLFKEDIRFCFLNQSRNVQVKCVSIENRIH